MTPPTRPRARRVEAVERAVAVLDVLAEAVELGTNEIARRTGINASSVSRLLATLAASGLVDQVDETGRYRLGSAPRRARQRGARSPRPPRARPAAPARPRRGHRRDGDALGAGRGVRDHRRLRPQPRVRAERRADRPPERPARDRRGQGAARLRPTSRCRAARCARTRRTRSWRGRSSSGRSRACARKGGRRRCGSGRTTSTRSPRRCATRPASSSPSSASRARRAASAKARCTTRGGRLLAAAAALSSTLGWA